MRDRRAGPPHGGSGSSVSTQARSLHLLARLQEVFPRRLLASGASGVLGHLVPSGRVPKPAIATRAYRRLWKGLLRLRAVFLQLKSFRHPFPIATKAAVTPDHDLVKAHRSLSGGLGRVVLGLRPLPRLRDPPRSEGRLDQVAQLRTYFTTHPLRNLRGRDTRRLCDDRYQGVQLLF